MDTLKCWLVVAVFTCTLHVSLQGPNQRRLLSNLLVHYNKLDKPVINDSDNITVEVNFSLKQIMDVDEKNQVLTTNVWLGLEWTNPYLQWNESDYPNVATLRFPDHLIWKPDILLFNSADERFDATYHTNILVKSSGTCVYIPPGIFKSSCHIDVRWFPFDTQRCELKFGSWTYDGLSLALKMVEADISDYIPNGEWDLVEVTGQQHEIFYECCNEPYHDVTYTIVMRRRTLYYGFNLLIPCVLISILALLVFLLPADSGEKISLGITVLLSLTVFMLLVAEVMPPTSDSVPLISQYFATTMVIVGLSIIATVVVLQFHHHDPNGSKMPKWTREILLNWCPWLLRMKHPGEDRVRSASPNKGRQSSIDLDPNVSSCNMLSVRGLEAGQEEEKLPLADPSSSTGHVEQELAKILEEVRFITKRFHHQDRDESVCNEWKFAAAVIDRLCLIAFSIFTILFTICILMSAPKFEEAISKDNVS